MKQSLFKILAYASLISAAACGCASSTALIRDPSMLVKDPGRLVGHPRIEKNVARVVSIWEPSTGKGLDDRNSRGFAGQILFFGPGCDTGARVRGKVNIYQYDQFDPDADNYPEPLHTFAFEPDAWEVHRTEGTLGHSYSVFIPYMNTANKDQVNCGLKVEIILEDGRMVSTQTTQVLLHGKNSGPLAGGKTRGFVQQHRIGPDLDTKPVVYNSESTPETPRKLETLTIPLPKR
jgi:hypothetical protein